MITYTKEFWYKNHTKHWLEDNTTFLYPKTVTPLGNIVDTLEQLKTLSPGLWVWKPDTGRQSSGVVLFEKTSAGIKLFPDKEETALTEAIAKVRALCKEHIIYPAKITDPRKWFVEEWVTPHPRLHQFTIDKRCPPIIRLCGRPKIHFVGMSPVTESETGLSAAGWQQRKYIWLDLSGKIRHLKEMDFSTTDKHSIDVANRKSLENAPFGEVVEGIPEVIAQINKEIAPKIRLYHAQSWSCDGTFDENDRFVVIELNHSPGLQFRGFAWR